MLFSGDSFTVAKRGMGRFFLPRSAIGFAEGPSCPIPRIFCRIHRIFLDADRAVFPNWGATRKLKRCRRRLTSLTRVVRILSVRAGSACNSTQQESCLLNSKKMDEIFFWDRLLVGKRFVFAKKKSRPRSGHRKKPQSQDQGIVRLNIPTQPTALMDAHEKVEHFLGQIADLTSAISYSGDRRSD